MFGTTNEDCTTKRKKRLDRQMEVNDVSLRFYLAVESDDDVRYDVKSVRVRRQTTIEDILPTLREKFQLQVLPKDIEIYTITDLGEIALPPLARPLDIVLQSESAPRFVVRTAKRGGKLSVTGRSVASDERKYGERQIDRKYEAVADDDHNDDDNNIKHLSTVGQTGNRGAPLIQNDLIGSLKRRTTPDLVGDCRRRPIIPTDFDYEPADVTTCPWTAPMLGTTMRGSDRNQKCQIVVAASDGTSDVSFGPNDSVASDPPVDRKKEKRHPRTKSRDRSADSAEMNRRRTKSRDRSADSARPNFKSKRSTSLRSSRSTSSLFQKSFSLRKKADGSPSQRTELSTEECSPGILKIFGDSITPGANYKSVLAVTTSTSRELVKEALDRYSIPRRKCGHYVLCDVIGRFMNYSSDVEAGDADDKYSLCPDHGLWTEECIRIIGDNERPLVLQRFWKPSEGYARRFELRRRSDLLVIEDEDTSGVNANARRLLRSKVKDDSAASSVDSASELESVRGSRESQQQQQQQQQEQHQQQHQQQQQPAMARKFYRHPRQHRRIAADNRRHDDDRADDRLPPGGVRTPTTCPFLVNVYGYDVSRDCVVFPIAHRCVKIGSDRKSSARNLYLSAPDIRLKHCELRLSVRDGHTSAWKTGNDVGNGDDNRKPSLRVQIHIHEGADVRINGIRKSSRMELRNGDVIGLGDYYQFVYRDPYAPATSAPDPSRYATSAHVPVESSAPSPPEVTQTNGYEAAEVEDGALKWRLHRSVDYDNNNTKLKLAYTISREDELLQKILDVAVDRVESYKLTPAYLLSMAVDYSAAKHDQLCTRTLLLKLATKIHNSVLRRARALAETQSSQSSDPRTATGSLLADLCPIILWMVNALELYNHFRQHMTDYLMDPKLSLTSQTRASVATAGEEVIDTLEEVVMYTFQQTVYYLTKAIYTCLPAITEGNPFHDDSRRDAMTGRPTMDQLIAIYQMTFDYLRDYKLHPDVVSQLFCYLFFFTNTSVFNSLMSNEKHFRWSRGVQIRGNLDFLEAWAVRNEFGREASSYLKKLVSLANLLSTPKAQLIKSSWTTLRHSFPDLNPSQLHHVLTNYEDSRFSQTWQPTAEDFQLIQNTEVIESFNGHPPLRLPTDGFLLNLNSDVGDVQFYKILNEFNAHFGVADDDVDSGLSLTQNFSGNELPRNCPTYDDQDTRNRTKSRLGTDQNPATPTFPNCSSRSAPTDLGSGRVGVTVDPEESRDDVRDAGSSLDIGKEYDVTSGPNNRTSDPSVERRPSPAENRRFRPIRAPPTSGSADESRSARFRRYSYGTRQGASFSIGRQEVSVSPNSDRHRNTSAPTAGRTPIAVSSSASLSCPDTRRRCDESPYVNLPSYRRRDAGGVSSLNSSISSQVSRDGNEVYHYMKDAVPVVDDNSGSVSLRPQMERSSPLYGAPTSHGLVDAVGAGTADVAESKSIVNEKIRKNGPNIVYPSSSISSSNLLRVVTDRCTDHISQPLDVASSVSSSSSSLLVTIQSRKTRLSDDQSEVFEIELPRGPMGFGMGLIDGLHTVLRKSGVYVRTLIAGSPAQMEGHLRLGDQILAVNGSSVTGVEYSSVMQTIKNSGDKIQLKIVHSDARTVMSVTASPC